MESKVGKRKRRRPKSAVATRATRPNFSQTRERERETRGSLRRASGQKETRISNLESRISNLESLGTRALDRGQADVQRDELEALRQVLELVGFGIGLYAVLFKHDGERVLLFAARAVAVLNCPGFAARALKGRSFDEPFSLLRMRTFDFDVRFFRDSRSRALSLSLSLARIYLLERLSDLTPWRECFAKAREGEGTPLSKCDVEVSGSSLDFLSLGISLKSIDLPNSFLNEVSKRLLQDRPL